ncbi:hypothetical protein ISN45_At02g025490 [Arabidopsis thaliana x Arabidopsis arenosa]|uniref:Uncharacterized protein n=2 Tax=Arabidopsis TaxID=3701 RepID=A0A8T2G7D6_ARASU|nr:hypothetical protein ISN45_At02g025490 [Arabidopsis thaliana x Arabidopsis arenosa]KAG7642693.1 hypothetical protein ISN44_As02g025820 [Arabidopsis suecica]
MGPLPNLSGLFNDFRGISVIISKYDLLSDQYDMGSTNSHRQTK